MKKSKFLLAILAIVFTFTLTACLKEEHTHTWTKWEMTLAPTEDTVGTKQRKCTSCDEVETAEVEVLTDENVWTLVEETEATCTVLGKRKYSNEDFGSVEVSLPLVEHTYEEYTLTLEPTETTSGLAKAKCTVCKEEAEIEVLALTDSSVWQLVDQLNPDYTQAGFNKYESKFGSVTVEFNRLVAPYENKTYTSFNVDASSDDVPYKNGK